MIINGVEITGAGGTSGTSGTSGVGSSGSSGTSGKAGTSGTSGTSGSSGTSGTSGSSGTNGTSGSSGTSGISGTSGSSGTSGIDGTSGSSGTSGLSGTSGTSGVNGATGPAGGLYASYSVSGVFNQDLSGVSVTRLKLVGSTSYNFGTASTSTPYSYIVDAGTYSFNLGTYSNYKLSSYDFPILGATGAGLSGSFFLTGLYDGDSMWIKSERDFFDMPKGGGGGGGFDTDAQAFFTATGITDTTIKNAVNALVVDLKSNSLWTKLYALYPLVGNSTQQTYNLKNTASYQITFNGGWAFSSTGAQGNASNTQANTGIDMSAILSLNSFSFGSYQRVSGLGNSVDMGSVVDVNNRRINFYSSLGGTLYFDPGAAVERITVATPGTTGFFIGTRTSSSTYGIYRNGSSVYNTTSGNNSATQLPNYPVVFGDIANSNPPSPVLPSGNEYALWFIGDGLTSTEVSTMNTVVQTFQTSLSRNV